MNFSEKKFLKKTKNMPYKTLLKNAFKSSSKILFYFSLSFTILTACTVEAVHEEKKEIAQSSLTPSSLFELQFPVDAGILNEVWTPPVKAKNPSVILHIQDAHCQYEAQMNTARMIEKLIKKYDIKLVAVEGTDGPIDTSSLGNLTGDDIKDKVMKYFVRQGKITGPEYLSIMKKVDFALIGIEESELYDANFRAFKTMLPFRKEAQELCENLSEIFDQLKKFIYSEELQTLDKLIDQQHKGEIPLPGYCTRLNEFAIKSSVKDKISLSSFPNFGLFIQSISLENEINPAEQEKELQELLKHLSQILSKNDLSQIISTGLQLRLAKIRQTDYYQTLGEILDKNAAQQSSLREWRKDWPQTALYLDYAGIYKKIDTQLLFKEIDDLSGALMEQLFENDDQRKLHAYTQDIRIMERLLLLETSRKDLSYYRERKTEFNIKSMLKFIKTKTASHPDISLEKIRNISPDRWMKRKDEALNFYRLANLRDQTLVKNTLKAMKNQNTHVAILITGGYHTEGVCDAFRKKGIAYAILSPKITKDQPDNPYLEVMSRQKSTLEEFLTNVEKND